MEDEYRAFADACEVIPAANQVEAHVRLAQRKPHGLLDGCGTAMQAWVPFTRGKKDIFAEPALVETGRAHGKPGAQAALRYLIRPGMAVIPKSAERSGLKENLDIFDFTLSDAQMNRIAKLDEGKSLFGWYRGGPATICPQGMLFHPI